MRLLNYRKLQLARESRGYTQSELVTRVPKLNQGNYSKMEKGLMPVPPETLENIAALLHYPVSFFYGEVCKEPISSFYYRKRVSVGRKELSKLEARLNIFRTMIDELLDSVDIPDYRLGSYEVTDELTPSHIAVMVRELLQVPYGPVKNLVRILEAAGVVVYFWDTEVEKFDGITLRTDKGHPIIFVNSSASNDRKRYTLCHELFHLIAHIPYSPIPVDRDVEAEANEFASEFLMPYLECRYDLQDLRFSQLNTLKDYWQISKAAIIRRALDTGGISPEKYKYLQIELSRRGERKNETGFVSIDMPTIVEKVLAAYREELNYELQDILNLLSIKESDFYFYFKQSKDPEVNVRGKSINLSGFRRPA